MALSSKILAQAAPATGSNSTLYTVPSSTTAFVGAFIVHNPQTSTGTVEVWAYPSGGSAANSTKLAGPITIRPGETIRLSELQGLALAASGAIVVKSTTAQVTYTLAGTERT